MRRRSVLLTAAALVVVVAGAAAVAVSRRTSALDRSIADLRDNGSFSTSPKAGDVLARISERLLDDGRRCSQRSGPRRPSCDRRLAAAGFASVAAVTTLRCTQPGTQQIRRDLLAHLEDLRRAERSETAPAPPLPRLPDC